MRSRIKNFLIVLSGTLVMAVSLNMFLIPQDIAPGGISGLSIVTNHLTKAPVGLLILIYNIPVFLWGLRHFSRKFLLFSLFYYSAQSSCAIARILSQNPALFPARFPHRS